jgi:crotonobetaine/carnitine-CoA ligase
VATISRAADERTIPGLLQAWASKTPDNRFCSLDEHEFTFASMLERSERVAAGFVALGIGAGDRVAILCPNRVEMLELFFALSRIGAIQVPLNAYLKGAFLKHQLVHSASSILVADGDGICAVDSMVGELRGLRHIVRLDEGDGVAGVHTVAYDELSSTGDLPPTAVGAGDVMSIMFTSGTTGPAKGCVLSHGYYTRCGRVTADALGLNGSDSIYSSLPLFHGGARLLVLTAALVRGLPVTIDSAFSARKFLPRAREVGATVTIGVGAMGQALMALPPSVADRAHHVHTMLVSPMHPDTQSAFKERFGIDTWTEFYGQTECVPVTCTPRLGDRDRYGCGRAAPDLEIALLGGDECEVGAGEVGEVCLRPRERFAMFDGYWNDAARTLEAVRGLWYHTGDTARRRPSGELEFVDRKTDSMRRRGENVSSMEVEAAIVAHPLVTEAAVHAVPSEQTEDDIKACIVLASGARLHPDQLFEHFKATLPYFAMPRYVDIVDELPKNAVGRVMKHVLRQRGNSAATIDFEQHGLSVAVTERRS